MRAYLRVLRDNPDFLRLWGANVIALLGDWFNTIVLAALVVRFSPGQEGTAVSLFLLARFLPPMLLSPFAGVLIDRMNRKHLLIASNVLRSVVVFGFLFVLNDPSLLWVVYLLTALQFTLSTVFEPGQASLIPNIVPYKDLLLANTIFNITWSVMLAFGAAVGGVIAALFGPPVALGVNVLTFLLSAYLISRIRGYVPADRTHASQHGSTGVIDGLRFLRRSPRVASTLLVKFGGSIGNVDAIMTIFATQIFILGADGQFSLGLMYSSYGIGAILGPLILNRVHRGDLVRMRDMITVGFVLALLGWIVLGWSASLPIVCLGLLIRAMGGSSNWTYSTVLIQKTTPDAYLGRVFSIDMMGFYLATVISTLIHGQLIDLLGAQQVRSVALMTALPAAAMLLVWYTVRRHEGRIVQPAVP
jgi:MFS family permease